MNKSKLNVRKIKCIGNCNDSNIEYLNPTTLTIDIDVNKNKSCPTKTYLDKSNKFTFSKVCEHNEKTTNQNLSNFMSVPYLNLPLEKILLIYNIDSIEDLVSFVDKNIMENSYYDKINRVLNAWNKVNFDLLKLNNDFLENIYFNIKKKYWDNIKENDDIVKKDIKKYIDSWFIKKNYEDFYFDLGNDLKKYLSKKYD